MRILLLLISCLFLTIPAHAQDKDPIGDDGHAYDERYALAQKMTEIWPIRPRVESALTIVAENFPEQERLAFKAQMRKNIQYDLLEEESTKAMALTFTKEELEKMIEFYGSPAGRSIAAKVEDYQMALQPAMNKMMDKAILDTKLGKSQAPATP